MRKDVVSSTLSGPRWSNSTVVGGDVTGEIGWLKREVGGNLLVAGTASSSRRSSADLIDELRLLTFRRTGLYIEHLFV